MLLTTSTLNPVVVCAWCEALIKAGNPEHGTSHGICPGCLEKQNGRCTRCGTEGLVGLPCPAGCRGAQVVNDDVEDARR